MLERMVDLTFSFINIHGFTDDNNNSYKSIVMNAMRMNQNYSSKCSHNILLDEESNANAKPNVDTIRFLNF